MHFKDKDTDLEKIRGKIYYVNIKCKKAGAVAQVVDCHLTSMKL
jgi:hypothetical protein